MMSETWVAIQPGLTGTRVLAVTGAGTTLLKARLRISPMHPRAMTTLLEAIALWEGQMVQGVLVAGDEAMSCGTSLFRDCFADFGGPPLYELAYATTDEQAEPQRRNPLAGFGDLRRLLVLDWQR
jgi:hypothetical protein